MTDRDPFAFADDTLRELEAAHLQRHLHPVKSGPGAEVTFDGRALINFSSNNYLGLAEHPALAQAAAEAAARWGTGATASRLIVGSHGLVHEFEERLAAWRGTEAALVLVGKADLVLADKLSHACLIDAARLSGATLRTFPHGDMGVLEKRLSEKPENSRALVVADGVFSMDGDLCDLPALVEITDRHGALLLIDDAHAVGVFGERHGSGTAEHFGLSEIPRHLIQTATMSKAMGSQGGFVCGPRVLCDLIVNRARTFIFTTGIAPPAVAAGTAALTLIEREPERRQRLWENRQRVAEALESTGWNLCGSASPILPLLVGEASDALALGQRLREAGILGVPIRPPTVPPGKSRVRLTVMATHTEGHLNRLMDAVGEPLSR
jgi:8-amino-7-oxononanoate synthase